MRHLALIFLLLLFNTSILARTDWCEFNTDFANKYDQARSLLANAIKKRRNDAKNPEERHHISTGRARTLETGNNWPQISLSKKVKELFPDGNYELISNDTGKVYIQPKIKMDGQPYRAIVYDTSGDYFRIVTGKVRGKKLHEHNNWRTRYLGNDNVPIKRPPGLSDQEWDDYIGRHTHFKATP